MQPKPHASCETCILLCVMFRSNGEIKLVPKANPPKIEELQGTIDDDDHVWYFCHVTSASSHSNLLVSVSGGDKIRRLDGCKQKEGKRGTTLC